MFLSSLILLGGGKSGGPFFLLCRNRDKYCLTPAKVPTLSKAQACTDIEAMD